MRATHKNVFAMGKLWDSNYDFLGQPLYYPDFAPLGFNLFPHLNKLVPRKRFASHEKVESDLDKYSNSLADSHIWEGIRLLKKPWTKCVEAEGDYV